MTADGQACVTASSPDEAEQMVSQHSFDMIICDINLDGHSGLELIAKLRKREELREIPVIFLSGADIPNIVKRAHAAGGNYYLRKPFDPSVLTELIDRALWMPHVAGVNAGM